MQASQIYAGQLRLMPGLCKAGPGLCRLAQAFAGLEDMQAGWAA